VTEGYFMVKVFKDRKEWLLNGKLHRTDGPAVEYASGSKEWHLNGELHRTDGPAIEWADGSKAWYLNGEELTKEDFKKQLSSPTLNGKIVEIEGRKYKLQEIEGRKYKLQEV
jgi:hypothetical protein